MVQIHHRIQLIYHVDLSDYHHSRLVILLSLYVSNILYRMDVTELSQSPFFLGIISVWVTAMVHQVHI